MSRARITRSRIVSDGSPGGDPFFPRSSSNFTAGTSTWISMRSINGPDTLLTYRWIWNSLHVQRREFDPKYPHGHGFIEATSVKFAGKVSVVAALAIVTCLSS